MKKEGDKGRQRRTAERDSRETDKKVFFPVNIKQESYGWLETYDLDTHYHHQYNGCTYKKNQGMFDMKILKHGKGWSFQGRPKTSQQNTLCICLGLFRLGIAQTCILCRSTTRLVGRNTSRLHTPLDLLIVRGTRSPWRYRLGNGSLRFGWSVGRLGMLCNRCPNQVLFDLNISQESSLCIGHQKRDPFRRNICRQNNFQSNLSRHFEQQNMCQSDNLCR